MPPDEFDDLAFRHLQQRLTAEEQRRFEETLRVDPPLRARFDQVRLLDRALRKSGPSLAALQSVPEIPAPRLNALLGEVARRRGTLKSQGAPSFWATLLETWSMFQSSLTLQAAAWSLCLGAGLLLGFAWASHRNAQLVVAVADPRVRGLDREGHVLWRGGQRFPELEPQIRSELLAGVADVLGGSASLAALQRIVAPSAAEVTLGPSDGATNKVGLLSPVNTVVRNAIVEFRWSAAPGASDYDLIVQPADTNLPPVRRTVGGLAFRWPDPFPAGRDYRWQVQAHLAAGLQASDVATFRVLRPQQLGELRSAEEKFRDSPLLLAAVYRQYGLLEEAKRARARLLQPRQAPGISEPRTQP